MFPFNEPSPYDFDRERVYGGSDLSMTAVMLKTSAMLVARGFYFNSLDPQPPKTEPVLFWVPQSIQYVSEEDPYVNGRVPEQDLHVTLKYGLLPTVSDEQIVEVLKGWKYPPDFQVMNFDVFDSHPDYDVVVARVDGPWLHEAHQLLSCLPHIDFHHKYRPHVTLAYVRKGYGRAAIDDFVNTQTENRMVPATFSFRTKDVYW